MTRDEVKSSNLGKIIQATFKAMELIISVGLLLMIFTTFLNVLIRYSNNIPGWSQNLIGSFLVNQTGINAELARLSFIYLVYLGSIIAARDNKHLMIDTVIVKSPPIVQKTLYVIIQLIIMYLMGYLAVGAWKIATTNMGDFWVATNFPVFLIHFNGVLLGVAFIAISLANLYRLFVYKESVVLLFTGPESGGEFEGSGVE